MIHGHAAVALYALVVLGLVLAVPLAVVLGSATKAVAMRRLRERLHFPRLQRWRRRYHRAVDRVEVAATRPLTGLFLRFWGPR